MASSIDYTIGPDRTNLGDVAAGELDARREAQTLAEDFRRARPRYFDGRFLAARDLTREQLYALTREADLAAAYRGGVIRGLELVRSGDAIRIAPGAGFTPNGELVTLQSFLQLAIEVVPEDDRIDLSHGLVDVAEPPARQRTGLYVLGLRPGEYAANPTTRFPLTVRGKAGTADGDIVEAVSLALHPLRNDRAGDPARLRSDLARATFFERGSGVAPDLLALAVVYLANGSIGWLDPYLVRRDVAADDAVPIGVAGSERALREAHFLQYDRQLAELVSDLRARGGLKFPASRYFRCLPPVGRMPVAAIEPADFTQAYFPPQMTVSLGVVVDTELPMLLEQSMHLPPIDLEGDDDDFDFTYLQVLVPMPANAIDRLRLAPVALVPRPIALPPVLAKRLPIMALRDFLLRRKPVGPDFGHDERSESAPLLAAWRSALAAAPDQMVWFVRVPSLSIARVELFDPPPKDKEKDKEKEKEKDKEASADKVAASDKTEEKNDDKGPIAEKTEEHKSVAVDKALDDKTATADKTTEKTAEKTSEKPPAEKVPDKVLEKGGDKSVVADKSVAADKAITDKTEAADKTGDKTVEKAPVAEKTPALEKTVEKTAEKSPITEKALEKTGETKTGDKVFEKTAEKTAEKTVEKSPLAEKTLEKTSEVKTGDKTHEKAPTAEKTHEKTAEKPAHEKNPHEVVPIPRDVATPPGTPGTPRGPTPTEVSGPGRTFIQPDERPDVGSTVIRKTRDT
jgi:hypothetical protein